MDEAERLYREQREQFRQLTIEYRDAVGFRGFTPDMMRRELNRPHPAAVS
jgi:hypothetical protein